MPKHKREQKCWDSETVRNNFNYLTNGMFLYETSLIFNNNPADAHIPKSMPTVRRHAEACLSTTYAYIHHSDAPTAPLGGRGVFPSQFCRAGRDPFSGPGNYFFTLKKTIPRKAISKPTRRIPLNFCIHLRITVLRKRQQGRFQF